MTHFHKLSLLAILVVMDVTSGGFAMAPDDGENLKNHSTPLKPTAPAVNTDNTANAAQSAAATTPASAVLITEAELSTDGVVPDSAPTASATAIVSAAAAPLDVAATPKASASPAMAPAPAQPSAESAQEAAPPQPQAAKARSVEAVGKLSTPEDSRVQEM